MIEKEIETQTIEDMAKVIEKTEQIAAHCGRPSPRMYAKDLYWNGYRKQIEGEWLTKGELFMEHYCSVCGYSVDYLYQRTPFCPNCGAKMKGGAE